MMLLLVLSLFHTISSLSTLPRFTIDYDQRTWWTCHFSAAQCLTELNHRLSDLLSIDDCRNRIHHVTSTEDDQLRAIQFAARKYKGRRSDEQVMFTPVMEVLANAALQRAMVCVVDEWIMEQLGAMIGTVSASVSTANGTYLQGNVLQPRTIINTSNQQFVNPLQPNVNQLQPNVNPNYQNTASTVIVHTASVQAPQLSGQMLQSGQQYLNQAPNVPVQQQLQSQPLQNQQLQSQPLQNRQLQNQQAQNQPVQSPDCKLPQNTVNTINQRIASLQAATQSASDTLQDLTDIVEGYTSIGGQFSSLAMDIRRYLQEADKRAQDRQQQIAEYEAILSGSGCQAATNKI